jgi:hypothetical protein
MSNNFLRSFSSIMFEAFLRENGDQLDREAAQRHDCHRLDRKAAFCPRVFEVLDAACRQLSPRICTPDRRILHRRSNFLDTGEMRFFHVIVLVSGCAMDAGPAPEPGIGDEMTGMDDLGEVGEDPSVHLVPAVCDVRAWPSVALDSKDTDLAVVPTLGGATIFGVAKQGGAVRGFRIDNRGDLVGDPAGTLVRDDRAFTGVTASLTAERLLVAGITEDKVALDIVREDLGARHELGDLEGTLVSDQPVLSMRNSPVALVGGQLGMTVNGFTGAQWEPADPVQVTKSAITSMTATRYLDDVMIAWSTDTHECHLRRFGALEESFRYTGCEAARIAANPASATGTLVYEDDGNVLRSSIRVGVNGELTNRLPVAELASSPRVVFDGVRTWISYLDTHGDVVVGFLDRNDNLISRALEGTRPGREGYELAVFADSVWVVAAGELGYGAQRLCVKPL